MNMLSLPRVALLAIALGSAGVSATFAQTTTSSTSTTPPVTSGGSCHHHDRFSVLTAAERAQLKSAHNAALAANPSLKTAQDNVKQQFQALMADKATATPDQWKAVHEQAHAFRSNLRSAELLIDPTLAPIFAKIDAAKQSHHHSA